MLLFKFRRHGQPSSGPIETLHGTWLWLRWTRHWQMGTAAKAGNWFKIYSSEVNSRMRWWKTPWGWTLWILGGRGGQHALHLLLFARFWRSKSTKGATIERQKIKTIKQEYQKQRCANFKTCNQWNKSFCKCNLVLFLCNGCFVEHKFEAVINA